MDLTSFSLDLSVLRQAPAPDPSRIYDLIIIGGGPAALSAAVYAARKMISVALITRDYGGQVRETSMVENYLGFQNINARDLTARFEEHVNEFNLPVLLGTVGHRLEKKDVLFFVQVADGAVFRSRTVIVATGARHRQLGVPGERELTGLGVAYCATCDAPFFRKKKVVVAGGGNSAFTTALDLLKVEAEVVMVNFASGWQADASLQERVRSYTGVSFLDYYQVMQVEGKDRVSAVVVQSRETGEKKVLPADGLFVQIGLSPNSELVAGLAERTPGGEVIIDCSCRTNVPGLFAAGDVTTVAYKQIIISAGEGAKAALSAYDYLVAQGWV